MIVDIEVGEEVNCLKPSLNEDGCAIDCCPTIPRVTASCSPVVTRSKADATCDSKTVSPPAPTVPPVHLPSAEDVTEIIVGGDGVFDRYMRAGNAQLTTQYDLGRIKGADYASAYVQMMEMMMTQANKFVLDLAQAEIAIKMFNAQYTDMEYGTALKIVQARKAEHEIDLVCQQIAELKENGATDRALKDEQSKETVIKAQLTCQQIAELEYNGMVERSLKKDQGQVQVKTAELYDRQIKGFDEKYTSDLTGQLLDAWAVQGVEFDNISDGSNCLELGKVNFNEKVKTIMINAGL